jgi:uncharacterized protein GlcG (DUF336 family)
MNRRLGWIVAIVASLTAGCSGGGSAVSPVGSSAPATNCTGNCFNATTFLTVADVQTVIAQGVAEAHARGVNATIAVVDRVGNVLAVFRMAEPAIPEVLISSSVDAANNPLLHTGLDGIRLPVPASPVLKRAHLDDLAAIAKAITGAYLSSEGNAFSTRTASQIIQEHFNVGESNQPSGPLFGVQFSQLACSDFIGRSNGSAPTVGPQRSPLGLSADPGGFPLYKSGTPVGGVGVIADGLYSLDKNITQTDPNVADEAIAYAATFSYAAPLDRRADQITANGVTLRFSDVDATGLLSNPSVAPAFATLNAFGSLIAVEGYADGQVHAGTAYGQPASGVRADTSGNFPNALVFVDAANLPRYPPISGSDGINALTGSEVAQILSSALSTANQARAQIRIPVGLSAQVTISVVDTQGVVLGMVRTPDAPLFGADVSLQKARSAAFFSSSTAAAFLQGLPDAQYLTTDADGYPELNAAGLVTIPVALGHYVTASQSFLSRPTALSDAAIAFSDRAIGNLSRPFFPDGIDGTPNGPLSKPAGQWSVFSDGLQLDLSLNAILQHVFYAASDGALAPDVVPGCAGVSLSNNLHFSQTLTGVRVANGLQIFPGSVPIYRGLTLVGAIGVSGDGVDQDDMVAFLGLERAITALNTTVSQAPAAIRADTLTPQGTRLIYVQCPQSPLIGSNQENVCAGF